MKNSRLVFLFMLSFNSLLNAQTNIVIPAAKDNTIYSDNTGNSNGAGDNFTTGAIFTSAVRRGLLMFDLSAIPAGAIITAASLTLVMNKTVSGASNVSLHHLNENWGEGASNAGAGADGQGVAAQVGDATWLCSFSNGLGGCSTAWGTPGSVFDPSPSATTSVGGLGSYTWSSSQMIIDVQNWVNTSATNFGWVIIGDEGNPGSAKRFSSRTNPAVADRPSLSVTYTTVVPVTLLYFKAQAQNWGTRLNWKTAQEINNDFFEIEFSTDAVYFTTVGKLKGAGTSSIPQSYSFTHQTTQIGKIFYRLSQTDFSGRKTNSQIESVYLKNNHSLLIITPNPVINSLQIPGFVIDGTQRYMIINSVGEKIAEAALLKQEIIIPKKIAPGIYFLKIVHSNGTVQSATFVKY